MNNSSKRNISKIIFEGPDFVQNKNYSVAYDCILNLMKLPYHASQISKAYGIFVDNTNNKHKNFLNPIIRFSEYTKNNSKVSPDVKYFKIHKKYFHIINELVSIIDIGLTKMKFVKAGLILDRIPPDNCVDTWEDFKNNFSLELYR